MGTELGTFQNVHWVTVVREWSERSSSLSGSYRRSLMSSSKGPETLSSRRHLRPQLRCGSPSAVGQTERGVADHTDGPPVTRLYHRGQGHSGDRPADCVTCGRDVASFLHSLRVGVTENVTTTATTVTSTNAATTPPCLQWRDVLVLYWYDISDDWGMVEGLQETGIPVQVMKDDDIEDVATACSDVVWVTSGESVCGLERKVVVCLEEDLNARFFSMSRCTSQLVFVCSYHKPNGI
ncbi:uncharacterized protein LOC112575344 [Pomacea canaliculata]|uniref:uncharacterized protein LOC112575344 n=1 Tax=Pomacea canaliculata TaxID=400727 RepID=UPI000D731CF7|nr:uncharacterized protein LOC112575344 [Pomacea canaliculata]